MSSVIYEAVPNYADHRPINIGGDRTFDVDAALTAGGGSFEVDVRRYPDLTWALDHYPGLVRKTPGSIMDNPTRVLARSSGSLAVGGPTARELADLQKRLDKLEKELVATQSERNTLNGENVQLRVTQQKLQAQLSRIDPDPSAAQLGETSSRLEQLKLEHLAVRKQKDDAVTENALLHATQRLLTNELATVTHRLTQAAHNQEIEFSAAQARLGNQLVATQRAKLEVENENVRLTELIRSTYKVMLDRLKAPSELVLDPTMTRTYALRPSINISTLIGATTSEPPSQETLNVFTLLRVLLGKELAVPLPMALGASSARTITVILGSNEDIALAGFPSLVRKV